MFTSSLRKSAKAQQYLPKSCRIEIRSQIINGERELTKVNILTSYRAPSFGDFYHSSKYIEEVLRYEAQQLVQTWTRDGMTIGTKWNYLELKRIPMCMVENPIIELVHL